MKEETVQLLLAAAPLDSDTCSTNVLAL